MTKKTEKRKTQMQRVADILIEARALAETINANGEYYHPDRLGWVSGCQFATQHRILRYSARIHELRERGWQIQTSTSTGSSGSVISFYRLVSMPGQAAA